MTARTYSQLPVRYRVFLLLAFIWYPFLLLAFAPSLIPLIVFLVTLISLLAPQIDTDRARDARASARYEAWILGVAAQFLCGVCATSLYARGVYADYAVPAALLSFPLAYMSSVRLFWNKEAAA